MDIFLYRLCEDWFLQSLADQQNNDLFGKNTFTLNISQWNLQVIIEI